MWFNVSLDKAVPLYENKTKSKNQSQYALLDCMDILIGKTLNMQLLAWSAPNCV